MLLLLAAFLILYIENAAPFLHGDIYPIIKEQDILKRQNSDVVVMIFPIPSRPTNSANVNPTIPNEPTNPDNVIPTIPNGATNPSNVNPTIPNGATNPSNVNPTIPNGATNPSNVNTTLSQVGIREKPNFKQTLVFSDFKNNLMNGPDRLASPMFSANNDDSYRWNVSLHPWGGKSNGTHIWLNLCAAPHTMEVLAGVQVSLLNKDNQEVLRTKRIVSFSWSGQRVFEIKREYLLDEKLELLHGHDLVVNLEIQVL